MVLVAQVLLDRFLNRIRSQHPLAGCLRLVVLLDYPASETLFGNELKRGLEEIDVEPQPLVKRGQNATGFKTFKPVVADNAANDGSVFLFDTAVYRRIGTDRSFCRADSG